MGNLFSIELLLLLLLYASDLVAIPGAVKNMLDYVPSLYCYLLISCC
jgi:hypothetical protein